MFKNFKLKIKNFVRHPLFSGSFLMIGGSMAINTLSYVYHLIVGRLLGPIEYGILASVFSIFYIVSVVPLSSSIAIVKFISSAKNLKEVAQIYKGINDFIIKLAIILAVVVILVSLPVSKFLNIPSPVPIMILAPILFFSLLTLVNQSTAQGLLKFIGVVGPNFTSNFTKLALGVVFIAIGLSVPGAMLAIAIGSLLAYVFSLVIIKKKITKLPQKSKFDLKPFFKYTFPALLQALAFTSLFTVDVILVKHFLPDFDAGLYASLSTSGKIIYFTVTPIAGVMFPIVSKRHSAGESYKKIFLTALAFSIVLSLGVDAVYYFFPKTAISILFGSKYLEASSELILMGIFITFYSLNYFLVNYFLAFGKIKVVLLPIVAAILQIIGIFFFWHDNITQVLVICITLMILVFVGLSAILVYGEKTSIGHSTSL